MPPHLRPASIGLCFVFFIGCSTEGIAMSIFSRPTEELVICSEMRGKLTFQGQPAAGAKIVRWSAWKDHEGESETFYADEHGNFLLPEKRAVVKKGPLDFLADRKSTRLNSSHVAISYAVFCLKKKKKENKPDDAR